MLAAADDLKRVTLELGGNDAAIVLDDVNPDEVAEGLFWGAFQNSGQVCAAIKRLYVPEQLHDSIVARLVDRAKRTKVGNGMEMDTELGPINNEMQFQKVHRPGRGRQEVAAARSRSAASGSGTKGYFLPPTIVTGVGEGAQLVDEEQFGTALPIIKYKHLADALEQANRTHFGLGGSVWSSNVERGEEVAREIESGTVLGEPAHRPVAAAAVRRPQVERHRRRERQVGLQRVHRRCRWSTPSGDDSPAARAPRRRRERSRPRVAAARDGFARVAR